MHIDTAGALGARERSTTARLTGKVCVIAGAAGVIGEATAERLRREGATVVGVDQKEHSVGALSLTANLTEEAEVERMFAHIYHEFGRIDVLVNNAGLNDPNDHSALDMTLETWERVLAANLTTTFLLRNDPPSGSVINTASFLAVMGAATSQMAHSAAKAAVIQLSRDLGTNLARRGVRVNAVCLGPIETPQLRLLFDSLPPEELPKRLIHYPMGRFGTLDELAAWPISRATIQALSPHPPFRLTAASPARSRYLHVKRSIGVWPVSACCACCKPVRPKPRSDR